ncbi:MAG: histidinol dehydrogenase [Verrucomicrobia bacterium]|nr:histidinol dehydrogenase [Verrucomicrobiota bacterium]MDA1086743.1 histidinol dehydrogenase [Verrucomicrobiota bacterium]
MKVQSVTWSPDKRSACVERFLDRPPYDRRLEGLARRVLSEIRRRGEDAVLKYVKKFDGADLSASTLRVSRAEIARATRQVDPGFRRAARETRKRVFSFARKGMRGDWQTPTPGGGSVGEQFTPLDRVGMYIPGGTAPLVSTALMTIPLARAAGVQEIVACTPPAPDGTINPYLLYALDLAGADEIYRAGGIPAIGLMAYGAGRIRPVQKIAGPGGAYVTVAKKCVYGDVALDLVAGPSEVAILAGSSANAAHVAADLLAQAEHGTGREKALLVTSSARLARRVEREIERQLEALSRRAMIQRVLEKGLLVVTVKNLTHGMQLCNRFAPEHLELLVPNAKRWARKVRRAGAIFCGAWTPEVAGDFVAGPSHVLPTGGAAAMFSGLTVDDFRKRSSVIAFTRSDLKQTLPVIEAFGRVEGLDAHARSATIRFEAS